MITSIPNFLISYLPRKLYVLKILVHPFFFSNHKGGRGGSIFTSGHPIETKNHVANCHDSFLRISTLAAQLRGWRYTHDGEKTG